MSCLLWLRFSCLVLFLYAICYSNSLHSNQLSLDLNAESAILINADTGAILYAKNPDALHYPASLTKIATAFYALTHASDKLDVMIAADQDSIGTVTEETLRRSNYTLPAYLLIPDGSHIGIKKDEVLSLKDLLYGLMIASGDDAANVIAKYVGGTIPQFMEGLNLFVKQLGCQHTQFYNPHGLHHPKQQTTAYDMALLTREAMKHPIFREIVATVRYKRPKTNKQEASPLVQTNRLLREGPCFYSKAIGVKTGYYSLAGHTFVAAAKEGERTLIAVLLKAPERKDLFLDAKKMFEAAFSQPKIQRTLLRKGAQKFSVKLPGANKRLTTSVAEDLILEYYPAEEQEIKCLLYWNKDLRLPIVKGQKVGELQFQFPNEHIYKKVPLYAQEDLKATWLSRMKIFGKKKIGLLKAIAAIAFLIALGLIILRFFKRS